MDIKKVHFYWGESKKMALLQFMTVYTFKVMNPDWEINLHTSQGGSSEPTWRTHEQRHNYDGKDYLEDCKQLCSNVVEFNCEEHGFVNHLHDVTKADILRQILLLEAGGLWSDMDIIWLRPIKELDTQGADVTVVLSSIPSHSDSLCHSSGVMYSNGDKNSFYQAIVNHLKKHFSHGVSVHLFLDYQAAGPTALNYLFPTMDIIEFQFPNLKVTNIPYRMFYPYTPSNPLPITEFFKIGGIDTVMDDTLAVHWFNGHNVVGQLSCGISRDTIKDFEGSPFFKHIQRFL